jgi:hypothetical protein
LKNCNVFATLILKFVLYNMFRTNNKPKSLNCSNILNNQIEKGEKIMKTPSRLMMVLFIALILTVATYAFAAANTFTGTNNAGDGANVTSGYTISGVVYTLDTIDPSKIKTVAFTIAPTAATSVQIQLITAGTWYPCVNTTGSVSCNIAGAVTATAANTLRVVAAQ